MYFICQNVGNCRIYSAQVPLVTLVVFARTCCLFDCVWSAWGGCCARVCQLVSSMSVVVREHRVVCSLDVGSERVCLVFFS